QRTDIIGAGIGRPRDQQEKEDQPLTLRQESRHRECAECEAEIKHAEHGQGNVLQALFKGGATKEWDGNKCRSAWPAVPEQRWPVGVFPESERRIRSGRSLSTRNGCGRRNTCGRIRRGRVRLRERRCWKMRGAVDIE